MFSEKEPKPSTSRCKLVEDIEVPRKFSRSLKSDHSHSSDKSLSMRFKESVPAWSKRQWKLLSVFAVANLIGGIVYNIKGPFYPAEAEMKGVTSSQYGFVFGIFELTKVFVCPIFGKYMSKFGPKRVLVLSMMLVATCSMFFGALDILQNSTAFLTASLVIRVFEAVGSAGFSTACFSIIACEFPDAIATTFASLETFFGIGLFLGPILGGVLFTMGGYQVPFIAIGLIDFFVAMVVSSVMPTPQTSPRIEERTKAPSAGYNIFTVLRIPGVTLSAISVFAAACSTGFINATLEPHIRPFNLTPLIVGVVFVIYGTVYALTAPVWGWLCDQVSQPKLLTLTGTIMNFVAFLLIGPAPFFPFDPILWVMCIGLVLHGLALGAIFVSGFVLSLRYSIAHGFPDNMATYGVVSGMWTSVLSLGMFTGPSIGGILLDQVGFRWGSVFILGLMFILFLLILIFLGKYGLTIEKVSFPEDEPLLTAPTSSKKAVTNNSNQDPSTSSKSYGAA